MRFKFGSDPEFLLTKNGQSFSAIPVIPGTKKKPHKVKGGSIQRDNVNLEINTNPADTFEQFQDNFLTVIGYVNEQFPDLRINAVAATIFPDDQLDNREARRFGCDPDFNAHTRQVIKVPQFDVDPNLRTTGGHVHIGKNGAGTEYLDDLKGKLACAIAMDLFASMPLVYLDSDPTCKTRRDLYGKAGAHRPKDYGLEYRALSSFWTRHPDLANLVYLLTQAAASFASNPSAVYKLAKGIGKDVIQDVINEGNRDECNRIFIEQIAPLCPAETVELYEALKSRDFTNPVVTEGWAI